LTQRGGALLNQDHLLWSGLPVADIEAERNGKPLPVYVPLFVASFAGR
jgi:hypothetical protein